jgi:acyl dehydratase
MEQPQVWTREHLDIGAHAAVTFTVTDADMAAFAAVSGDYNPLHTDAAFARARGFAGPVVFGGLLIAKVSQLIGMQLPGRDAVWSGVAMRFHRPLFVGEEATVHGEVTTWSPATGFMTLQLRVASAAGVIAKGSADVVLGRE